MITISFPFQWLNICPFSPLLILQTSATLYGAQSLTTCNLSLFYRLTWASQTQSAKASCLHKVLLPVCLEQASMCRYKLTFIYQLLVWALLCTPPFSLDVVMCTAIKVTHFSLLHCSKFTTMEQPSFSQPSICAFKMLPQSSGRLTSLCSHLPQGLCNVTCLNEDTINGNFYSMSINNCILECVNILSLYTLCTTNIYI